VIKKNIYIMASGNAKSGKEESWLAGLEHTVEGFVSGILPTHKTVALDSTVSATIQLKGTLTLRKRLLALDLTDLGADGIDDLTDVLGGKVSVELVSSTSVDPKTGKGLQSPGLKIANWSQVPDLPVEQDIKFNLNFHVPKDFGAVGAIIVHNGHPFEFLLVSFSLALPDQSTVIHFPCNSWVYNTSRKPGRIFFSNQVYLPSQTPAGLVALRAEELNNLRGDGTGVRRVQDRIYDYAVYNDLGNPDYNASYKRPVLGGSEEFPYPRRCRTGRPPTKTVPESESPPPPGIPQWTYIPRDEAFAQYKNDDFVANTIRAALESVTSKALMSLAAAMEINEAVNFESFEQIFKMYAPKGAIKGLENLQPEGSDNFISHPLEFIRTFFNRPEPGGDPSSVLYPLPGVVAGDKVSWSTNAEFTREFVAGLNPMVITRVTEFPLKSQMDSFQYGDPVSAITAKHVNSQLPDGWEVYKALAAKKLFVVDYHDTYITYINRINAQPGTAFYASRTLLFLTSDGTLQVLAIELTLPPSAPGGAKNSRVFLPPDQDSTKNWVWELAKTHVMTNDSAFHQVVNHL
jgi:lipoxygenase